MTRDDEDRPRKVGQHSGFRARAGTEGFPAQSAFVDNWLAPGGSPRGRADEGSYLRGHVLVGKLTNTLDIAPSQDRSRS